LDVTLSSLLGGLQLGSATPQPLGTAGAGSSPFAARQDHVHAMPTAANVGADPAGTGAAQATAAVAAHTALADPHPQYLTPAEGNAAYEAIGAAAAAIAAHTSAGDPHSQYLTPGEANAAYQPLDAQLTSLAGLSYTGNAGKAIVVNGTEDGFDLATPSGGGGGTPDFILQAFGVT
jgi:hypothetical protein